jgi:hypothetical protein
VETIKLMPPETALIDCILPVYKVPDLALDQYRNRYLLDYIDLVYTELEVCASRVRGIKEWYAKQPL